MNNEFPSLTILFYLLCPHSHLITYQFRSTLATYRYELFLKSRICNESSRPKEETSKNYSASWTYKLKTAEDSKCKTWKMQDLKNDRPNRRGGKCKNWNLFGPSFFWFFVFQPLFFKVRHFPVLQILVLMTHVCDPQTVARLSVRVVRSPSFGANLHRTSIHH